MDIPNTIPNIARGVSGGRPHSKAADMSATPSCGLAELPSDSIDRLGFIAIRYRAWMGEALAHPFPPGCQPTGEVLRALSGSFDLIEHLAEDFLIERGARTAAADKGLASSVMDHAVRMKGLLTEFEDAVGDRLVPSMRYLELLCLACAAHGGVAR